MQIIIATVTAGAGHLQAASALEEAWKKRRPTDRVNRLDVLDFTPRLYRKAYVEGYVKLVEHAPELWGHMFKRTDNPVLARRLNRVRRALARVAAAPFVDEVRLRKPRVVLCTHYMPLDLVGRSKEEASESAAGPFIVSVVTDFEAHALWMDPAVDLYCVGAEETQARLVARGVPQHQVCVTGIPVSPRFAQPVKVEAVRKRLGLRDDVPVLLVLSGGFGMGPVKDIMAELNKLTIPVQIQVICGRNEELRRELALLDMRHPTDVFGFVKNMHEFMAVADLVITKPGGLTSSEALAAGKPILVINPIPGQEEANSDFLLEHGAAVKVNRVEDLPYKLKRLFHSKQLERLAAAARALGRPTAALQVCHEVLARLGLARRTASRRRAPTKTRASGRVSK